MFFVKKLSRSANSAPLRFIILCCLVVACPPALYAQRAKQAERLPGQMPPAAQACVGCHGNQGQGNPDSGSPRIAGQSDYYLLKQLDSYADGSRRDRVMEPIARGLPPELRAEIATYYAALDAPFENRSRRFPERGQVLAITGDNGLGVQACRNCHGPGGVGEPPNIPYLAGLDASYITAEMIAWKEGRRTNDAGLQMFTLATAMSLEDIRAVAQYYASLTPPRPAPRNLVQAPPPHKKLLPGTTPVAQTGEERIKGVGVEQGAPMTGGTPGKGGTDVSRDGPSDGTKGAGGSDVAKSTPSKSPPKTGGAKGASGTDTPKAAPKTNGSKGAGGTEASKAPAKSSGTQWPRLSDAATADTAPVSSSQPVRDGDPARGRAIIASGVHGCAACHTIPGIRAPAGIVGPPLGGILRRGFIAGQLPNRFDVLVAFLQDPPALVPQTGMPNVGLTGEQARHIAAYLYTLKAPR